MRRILQVASGALALLVAASPAIAQQTLSGWSVAGDSQVQIGENQFALSGHAEIQQGDTKLYADHVDFFPDQNRAIATGNVLFSQGSNRIAADTADFNTKTRLGTFQHAYGIASMKPPRRALTPGIAVPQMTGQDSDVYFFGDIVEKIGPRKYKISNGGFTTCVQPTPRWDLHADTVVLHVNHYTMLRDAVLKVKGVPMLYLPFMYYPTKEEERATGILIPTYGVSSIRGQSITNHFFWAIDRSQDLTIEHDWYSKAGQGVGSEYRYNWGGGSDGNVQALLLDQRTTGATGSLPNQRSFTIRGNANQTLPGHLRARANVYYFSSLETNQTFNANIYDASNTQRLYTGNVVGAWRTYSLNATYNHNESFYSSTNSIVSGATPRISLSRNERPIFVGAPVYFTFGSEYAHLDSASKTADSDVNRSLSRFDVSPQVRYPFKKWQFFTVNSSAQWRDTYYTRSLDPVDTNIVRDDGLNRHYFTLQAQAVGPVFNRIWDTPNNGYAEKFKHTIEPTFTVQRISSIDPDLGSRIVATDTSDYAVGGTTNLSYGVNNRFYAKRKLGQISVPQEFLAVSLSQSYYTNSNASRVDISYQTSSTGAPADHFSPIKLDVRMQPTTSTTGSVHAEVDSRYKQLRLLSVNNTYSWTGRIQTTAGWTRRFFIKELPPTGFNNPATLDNYLNISTNAQTRDNRFGGRYTLYYDILRRTMQTQRFSWFYNAQCCGLALEYQTYSLGGVSAITGVSTDHRFFLSFTLAGLGSVSPFNGGLSGLPR